jgi:hypothetical protein
MKQLSALMTHAAVDLLCEQATPYEYAKYKKTSSILFVLKFILYSMLSLPIP